MPAELEEKPGNQQEGLGLDAFLGAQESRPETQKPNPLDTIANQSEFDDGTPDYVTKLPTQAGQADQSPSRIDPNQVVGPDSPKLDTRVSGDQAAGRLTDIAPPRKVQPNPANKESSADKAKQKTETVKETAGDLANAATGELGGLVKHQAEKLFGGTKLGRRAASIAEDVADIGELVATAGTDVRTWWKLLKKHWQLIFWPAIIGATFAVLLGLAIGLAFAMLTGNSGGSIGIPGNSTYLSTSANPNGVYLDIMRESININDPKTKKTVARLTLEATSGGFSDERDAIRATEANSAGKLGDDGQPIVGRACLFEGGQWLSDNGTAGVDCLAGGDYYDLTTGTTRKLTDDELKWYVTARWPYVKTNWYARGSNVSPRTILNPSQPKKYFAGRKVVLYNPATNKAVVGVVSEWGPAPWTGIQKSSLGKQAAAWKYGPSGPEPRMQIPQGYEGRIGGGGTAISTALGANSDSPIVMGYLDPDSKLGLGPVPETAFKVTSTTNAPLTKVPLFKQANYRDIAYPGGDNSSGTISSSGCGIVSAAMVLAYYGKGVSTDPKVLIAELANWALNNGSPRYRRMGHAGTDYAFFPAIAEREGLKYESITSWDKVMAALRAGRTVIVSGKGPAPFTTGGHFVVLTGITSSGTIIVNDPARISQKVPVAYSEDILKNNFYSARSIYQ